MNHRRISLLLIGVMLIVLFAGCAATTEETTQPTTQAVTEETVVESSDAPAETQPTTEVATEETAMPTSETTAASAAAPGTTTAPTAPSTTAAPTTTAAPEPTEPVDLRSIALNYIGQSVSSLYAAIGYPNSSSYASSCVGPGEDGELYYNGFTVYTYRENDVETVVDVW